MFRPPTAISNVLNNSVIRTSAPPCSLSDSKWSWLDKSESTVSQWDLVCDRAYLQGFAQSAFFIGGILGSSIFGHLSDWKLGRRGALALSTISLSVFGMLTAVAPNYGIYVICRALTGASSSGLAVASYVLIMELIGPSCRATVGLSTMYFFPIGSFLLVAVASAYRKLASVNYSWRYVYVITSIPSALYSISVVPSIHESPRWHLVRGRTQKAMEVLRSVAKKNGRNLTNDVVLITDHRNKDVFQNNENMPQEKGSLVQVFRRRDTRYRIIVLVVSWFACALGYYVFNLNVGNLGTNIYLSVTLNGMVEIPGYAVATLLLHRIGRRRSLVAALIVAGMATLSGAVLSSSMIKLSSISAPGMSVPTSDTVGRDAGLIPVHNHASPEMKTMGILSIAESHILRATEAATYIQLASSLMSLFCLSAAYNILYFYGSELFPTTVRNAAVSFAYQGGTMGSIVAPLVVASAQVNSSIPYFIIGAASLVSGVIAIKLPETMNTQLYESFEDMDTNLNEV
ncbi:hypothetical protein KP509_12G085900 [Ceratopteris richardii]|nr:hypothetical protein KP509_12G085900 [Ceratopteris richardii]